MPNILHPISDPEEIRAAQAAEIAKRAAQSQAPAHATEGAVPVAQTAPGGGTGSGPQVVPAAPVSPAAVTPPSPGSQVVAPAGIYPEPTHGSQAQANQAAAQELIRQPKERHIGLYVIVGLVLLSALSTFISSNGSALNMIVAGVTLLVGLGLLGRYEIARIVFVIVEVLGMILTGIGLLAYMGLSATSGQSGVAILLNMVHLAISAAMVIYITRPNIKALFG